MYRQVLAEIQGENYLKRFRNGLIGLDEEVKKIESIVSERNALHLSKNYFSEESVFLSNIDEILVRNVYSVNQWFSN